MALIIAALSWALVYYSRDELRLVAQAPEDEIPVQSSVSSEEGFSQVRRRQQRLDHVIQEVAEADHHQHCIRGPLAQCVSRRSGLNGTHDL